MPSFYCVETMSLTDLFDWYHCPALSPSCTIPGVVHKIWTSGSAIWTIGIAFESTPGQCANGRALLADRDTILDTSFHCRRRVV